MTELVHSTDTLPHIAIVGVELLARTTCQLPESLIGDGGTIDMRVGPRVEMDDASSRRDIGHFEFPAIVASTIDVKTCKPSGDGRGFVEYDVELDLDAFLASSTFSAQVLLVWHSNL